MLLLYRYAGGMSKSHGAALMISPEEHAIESISCSMSDPTVHHDKTYSNKNTRIKVCRRGEQEQSFMSSSNKIEANMHTKWDTERRERTQPVAEYRINLDFLSLLKRIRKLV
jgi:hypothetical protein